MIYQESVVISKKDGIYYNCLHPGNYHMFVCPVFYNGDEIAKWFYVSDNEKAKESFQIDMVPANENNKKIADTYRIVDTYITLIFNSLESLCENYKKIIW